MKYKLLLTWMNHHNTFHQNPFQEFLIITWHGYIYRYETPRKYATEDPRRVIALLRMAKFAKRMCGHDNE